MLTSLLVCAAIVAVPAQTVELIPTDDVWVYPFAGDATKDTFLRVWGASGRSVADGQDSVDEFSYSLLQWDVSSLPKGELKEAKLIVFHIAETELSPALSRGNPMEVRPLATGWTEKGWQHSMVSKFAPMAGEKAVFGSGFLGQIETGKPFKIEIDLLKGPGDFKAHLIEACRAESKKVALGLTSKLNPAEMGRSAIYKLYSKDGPAETRPVLRVVF
jgi:hypothetical protein